MRCILLAFAPAFASRRCRSLAALALGAVALADLALPAAAAAPRTGTAVFGSFVNPVFAERERVRLGGLLDAELVLVPAGARAEELVAKAKAEGVRVRLDAVLDADLVLVPPSANRVVRHRVASTSLPETQARALIAKAKRAGIDAWFLVDALEAPLQAAGGRAAAPTTASEAR